MALADTMVVMNHGVIVQSGTPHEVYNRPANEFVARFMGGHNVIQTPFGLVGVRTDHIALSPASDSHGTSDAGPHAQWAVVSDVEYQGTYVLLGLQSPGTSQTAHSTAQWSVMLSEAVFAAQPLRVGNAVRMSWASESEHPLAP
jgi:putative spermidine/putrescine transport system ATP-binding protein